MSSYSKSSEFFFSVNKYDQVRSQYYTYYDSVDVALCDNVWPSWFGITVKKKRFPQGFNYEPINPFKNLYQGTRYWLESKYFVSWITNLIWTDFFFFVYIFFIIVCSLIQSHFPQQLWFAASVLVTHPCALVIMHTSHWCVIVYDTRESASHNHQRIYFILSSGEFASDWHQRFHLMNIDQIIVHVGLDQYWLYRFSHFFQTGHHNLKRYQCLGARMQHVQC